MSFGGAADGMKKSYENNRSLLGKRKSIKEIFNEQGFHYRRRKYTYAEADPESLKQLHQKLIRENRISFIVRTFILLAASALIFGGAYYLLFVF